MNGWWWAAAAGLVVIGAVHSVLGERMIFRHLRRGSVVPQGGAPALRAYQTRILWASWHLVTLFGWALAAVLVWLAGQGSAAVTTGIALALAASLIAAAALVGAATRGRHLAWVALLLDAGLVLAGLLQR